MTSKNYDALIIGAGIFGVTTALELQGRGLRTALLDPGPLPHPLAASTDISKAVRMEYGADEQYMSMVEAALPGWRAWNEEIGDELFHEVGVTMLSRGPMSPGEFEYESFHMLQRRGHQPRRLDSAAIAEQFPAWDAQRYVDGFYHAKGGYAESGRVVEALVQKARREGVALHAGQTVDKLDLQDGRVHQVRTRDGSTFSAAEIVLAAGAWTPVLLPELAPMLRVSGHPVFHLRALQPELFTPPHFAVFTADISHSGWYGFPFHPREKVVKIANHGPGLTLHPQHDERVVTAADQARLRQMLAETFPSLVQAPIVYTRRCLYCDTKDEHFWIDRHPEVGGLTVATGGSGHGFKFAPVLGPLIADAVLGQPNEWLPRFAWREFGQETTGEEESRNHAAAA